MDHGLNPSTSGTERPFPFRIGSYRIEQQLASGGMGVVYRAFDEALRRPLAIKHLLAGRSHPKSHQRFRREARAAARLNHPAIVQIYDIVETEEGDWIVMELVEGQTLSHLMRERSLPLTEALHLGREIAEGLAEAHAQGIVHRDLKASNVMVTASGHAKILDFGLAKFVFETTESELSQPGTLLGTYHAMSPEQVQGLPVDHLSDLFSLGSLLYEMLTGVSPFRSATVSETLARVCSLQQPAVCQLRPEIPRELSDLVDRLLSKAATQRPRSTREVAKRLEWFERRGGLGGEPARLPGAEQRETPADSSEGTTLAENPPGKPLEARGSSAAPSLLSRERRQMTVICCELDAGDASLDPETLYDLMLQLRGLADSAARRYGGLLGSVLGRRLLLYFGYPQSYEDNAARAVQAALDLLSEVVRIPLALRVGIHTGPAVVATLPGTAEPVNLGATLDLAIGLQSLAEPGSVVVSPATGTLLQRSFVLEPLAPARLPGLSGPVSPQRVLEAVGQPDVSVAALAPLVGRDIEMAMLLGRWSLVCEGTGQVVLISGDAGIGKSRLVRALRERLGERSATWLSCHGSPLTQSSPLQPVIDLLRRTLAREEGDSPLDQLEAFLGRSSREDALPLLASLLDLPSDGRHPAPNLAPDRQREKTLEALVGLMLDMAESQPLVLTIEDLHWLDPTTLEWLDRLIDEAATVPLLLVLTLRLHTVEHLWRPRAHLTQLPLSPLSQAEVATLIAHVAGDRPLLEAVREQIVVRTDGVPLFVEELTKTVLEAGETGERRELPATLRDSLAARLGRLGAAKEIAQLASVIGRSFSLDLLMAVSSQDETALQRELKRLVQAELLYRKGFGSQTKYLFKHALVQDAAYESLLKRERQQLHLRIAEVMKERLSGPEPVQPEVIARHFTAGESFDRAVDFWFEAGRQALARFAHAEAIEHLRNGLAALAALPPGGDRDRRELPLQSALAGSVAVLQGVAAPEVEVIYERILALNERIEDFPNDIYFGLYNFYAGQGKVRLTRDLGLRRLQQGQDRQDPDSVLLGWYTIAASSHFLGDLDAARKGFEQLLSLYPAARGRQLPTFYDIEAVSGALLGEVLWLLGHPDAAVRRCDEAIAFGRSLSPFTHSIALVLRMYLAQSMRDISASVSCAGDLLALCRENDLEFWPPHCHMVLGLSDSPIDADRVLQDIGGATSMNQLQSTRFQGWAIEAFVEHGRADLGRSLLQKANGIIERGGERYWEADLRRLEGRLFQMEGAGDGRAEGCFQEALAVARGQGARIFELRAAVCLARLWHSQGRSGEARDLLRPLYDSFTEGLATPDLVAARQALATLEP